MREIPTEVWLDCLINELYVFAVTWRTGEFLVYMASAKKMQVQAKTSWRRRKDRVILIEPLTEQTRLGRFLGHKMVVQKRHRNVLWAHETLVQKTIL